MPARQLNIMAVIIALIISLGLMLGGQYTYERYYVKRSVEVKLSHVVKVEELNIASREQPPTVYIRVAQMGDLQTTYQRVAKIVHQELGNDYQVVFLDRRTPKLIAVYENSQFAIQEAMATGGFQRLPGAVQDLARVNGVNCQLSVDSENIYLQMRDQRGYLYQVIPRQTRLANNQKAYSQGGEGI